jgi:putative transposase
MDVQFLPAIEGNNGFEYKISLIHMATRVKYSEIHEDAKSETLAAVFRRAIDLLPPFFVVFTDNAMTFTMKYTAHPERKTIFTQTVESLGINHYTIAKGKPWKNGFIERSNRTDNEELFNRMRFSSSEERKYYLKLWEMEYNYNRPHQGIGNQTPFSVYSKNYQMHSKTRSIYA